MRLNGSGFSRCSPSTITILPFFAFLGCADYGLIAHTRHRSMHRQAPCVPDVGPVGSVPSDARVVVPPRTEDQVSATAARFVAQAAREAHALRLLHAVCRRAWRKEPQPREDRRLLKSARRRRM